MPETDFVVQDLKITQEGLFDFKELYNMIRSWINLHRYDFYEKSYNETLKEQAKDIRVHFMCERKIDDYIKFRFELQVTIKDHKIVKSPKGKNLVQGNLTIEFDSKLESDFDATWEGRPLVKFTRAIYDKFVKGEKLEELRQELKKETYDLYNEIKSYLNLHRF